MRKREIPEELTTDDVMSLFGWSRSEVSRRRRSGDLPEPDPWRSSPRKPRWARDAIMDVVSRMGLLEGVVLAAFDGDPSEPVRWRPSGSQFLRLPAMTNLPDGEQRTHLYRVQRYLRRDGSIPWADTPEYQLSLCIAVDEPNPHRVFNALLVRSEVAHALGYGDGEAGTVAVILPGDNISDPQLWFARVPVKMPANTVLHLERVEPDRIPAAAHFLGHPVPAWLDTEITAEAAARWNPEHPGPVPLPVPRALAEKHAFGNMCRAMIARIERGVIDAPAEVVAGLVVLAHNAWWLPLANLHRNRRSLPQGWAWMFELPEQTYEFPDGDMYIALRWLVASPDAIGAAAEFGTRYFGYDASIAVAVVDLAAFTPATRAAIEQSLRAVPKPPPSWLQTALDERLRLRLGESNGDRTYWEWAGDPDAAQHPLIRVGDLLALHVPQGRLPIVDEPAHVEVVDNRDTEGAPQYFGVVVDIDGKASPLPIRPGNRTSVGHALTTAVWAPDLELYPGTELLAQAPEEVDAMLAILDTDNRLRIPMAELTTATGPGPGPHADRNQVYGYRKDA